MMLSLRPILIALAFAVASLGGVCSAQEDAPLPPPVKLDEDAASNARSIDDAEGDAEESACVEVVDLPLTALTVDTYPRDKDGLPIQVDQRPRSCWAESGRESPAVFVSGGVGGWNCPCLLQLARFRHHPLYFEDVALERCGEDGLFPGVRSTLKFACDFALLPGKLLVQRPHACLLTPTPTCCSPYSCCCP